MSRERASLDAPSFFWLLSVQCHLSPTRPASGSIEDGEAVLLVVVVNFAFDSESRCRAIREYIPMRCVLILRVC